MKTISVVLCALIFCTSATVYSQTADTTRPKPVLYVVGTSHLDTQWRWDIRTTINEYVPATFADNYKLLDQFPDYTFSFEGSFRYKLLREYHPDLYARLKPYIDAGRWRVTGSWVDAVDVNLPSFEALVRHTLYGNGFYKKEFGVTSRDVFLPDCFGFGYALPSIASHCGLKSFSTQKLTWGSWVGIPFDIGVWEGVDGSSLLCAVNPGEYVGRIEADLSLDTMWLNAAERLRKSSGAPIAYRYFGTGDVGGAPDSTSVDWLQKSLDGTGPLAVKSIGADDIIDVMADYDRSRLPRYKGELLMTRHGVGCYTSQAAMKRWNRKNELLADATERACVSASLLGGMAYPTAALRDTWERFLWHGFHDDLTGTSIPEAYTFSWNDEVLCLNRFAGMMEHAASAITSNLDTRASGVSLAVFNPMAMVRNDLVEARVRLPKGHPEHLRVFGPDGIEVPSQMTDVHDDGATVLFLATVPSVGWAVYDVRTAARPFPDWKTSANQQGLENSRYRVRLDENGDVASIHDKVHDRELLAAPIRFELLYNKPNAWPSWEIDYDEVQAEPRALLSAPAQIEVLQEGQIRSTVLVIRKIGNSVFKTKISLGSGLAADRVTFDCEVDWYERETLLKASFPFTTANEHVTYDLGLGTIQRGQNHPKLYEVPGQQWADLTSRNGEYGVAVVNDCKYGWDHPDSSSVRLTLIHTPGVYDSWSWVEDERSQDNGHHKFSFAVVGHQGDWREGQVVRQGAAFNQPMIAFQTSSHPGGLGKSHSLLAVDAGSGSVHVNAIKQAEESDETIVRLRETSGLAAPNVTVRFFSPIVSAREVNGAEEPIGPVTVSDGVLRTSFGPYQPRAFAVRLQPSVGVAGAKPVSTPLTLTYDLDGISLDDVRTDGDFEGGRTIAGEMLPDTIVDRDIVYVTGPKTAGALNVVSCNGQTLPLPSASANAIALLVNSVGGPAQGVFSVGGHDTTIWIQDYAEPIAQWNNRLVAGSFVEEADEIAPGYINRQDVAWYASHRHNAHNENEAYQFTYLFRVLLPIPSGATTLTLPNNPRIRLFAATAVENLPDAVSPAQPLYDVQNATLPRVIAHRKSFVDSLVVELSTPTPGASLHYTVDGSEPTEQSPMYAGPIVVTETTNLKARALHASLDDGYVAAATFTRLGMTEPIVPAKTSPGLACTYYEGSWDKLPGFDTLKSEKAVVLDSVAVPPFARDEDYGVVLRGYITVPKDGLYDFFIGSDDGSDFRIADTLLIDNDGLHGMGDVEGGIGLKAGTHQIQIRMFQKKGDEGLRLLVDGPGVRKQTVPPSWLSHAPEMKRAKR
jgi:alpha-mannosidase